MIYPQCCQLFYTLSLGSVMLYATPNPCVLNEMCLKVCTVYVPDYIPIRTTGAQSPNDYSPHKGPHPRSDSRGRDPSTDSQPPRTPGHLKPITFEQLDRPSTPLLDQQQQQQQQQQSVGYQPYDQPPPRPPLPNHMDDQGKMPKIVQRCITVKMVGTYIIESGNVILC